MTTDERLNKLERENRVIKQICGCTFILILVALTAGAAVATNVVNADVVSAKKFVLYDEDGSTERGEWSVKDNITILENRQRFENGVIRARFVCSQNGGGSLELLAPDDSVIGEFGLVEGQSPELTMKNIGGGDTRVRIRARSTAEMQMYGSTNSATPAISLTAP